MIFVSQSDYTLKWYRHLSLKLVFQNVHKKGYTLLDA